MDHPEISIQISDRVRGGELPSAVLRALLKEYPDCDHRRNLRQLGTYLIGAFDDFTLFHCVSQWKSSKNSEAWDRYFDVLVIEHLLSTGVQVPWSEEFCNTEWERIKPVLAADEEAEHKSNREEMSYERLLEKIRKFTGELVCIQALWDGDTKGWYIWMSAVLQDSGSLIQQYLGTISLGSDVRVLRGIVPPWPEAIVASEVGSKLASTLGVEFYFPSPETADDRPPNWVDLWGANRSFDSKAECRKINDAGERESSAFDEDMDERPGFILIPEAPEPEPSPLGKVLSVIIAMIALTVIAVSIILAIVHSPK